MTPAPPTTGNAAGNGAGAEAHTCSSGCAHNTTTHADMFGVLVGMLEARIPPFKHAIAQLNEVAAADPNARLAVGAVKANLFGEFASNLAAVAQVRANMPAEIEAAKAKNDAQLPEYEALWERIQPTMTTADEIAADLGPAYEETARAAQASGQTSVQVSGESGQRLKDIINELAESSAYGNLNVPFERWGLPPGGG